MKRGLGLLVLAAIGYLIVFMAQSGEGANTFQASAELVGYLLAALGLLGGLVLLAVGLLRD